MIEAALLSRLRLGEVDRWFFASVGAANGIVHCFPGGHSYCGEAFTTNHYDAARMLDAPIGASLYICSVCESVDRGVNA